MSKISVIIPVYKAEKFLSECVDSVLGQTYRNLEVILVDDGSPDNCGKLCDAYAAQDARVKVIHQCNAGVSAARNAGLDAATGDFVAFVDADDYIDSQMYETMLHTLQQTQVEILECNYRRLGGTNPGSGKVHIHTGKDAVQIMFTRDGYPDGFTVAPVNKLIRRDIAKQIRFLEGCAMAEDMLYVVELFCKAEKVGKLERRLYTYRVNEESATLAGYNVRHADEVDAVERAMNIMDATGSRELVQLGRNRYVTALVEHWIRCRMGGTICAEKAKELRKRFLKDYCRLKVKLGVKQRIKYTLFWLSPECYLRLCCRYRTRCNKAS